MAFSDGSADKNSKTRLIISSTWIGMIFSSLQGDTYRLSDPNALEKILNNTGAINTSIELITIMAMVFTIPILLIVLTLILNNNLSKWINRIFSIVFVLFHIGYLVSILFIWKSVAYEVVWAISGLVFPLLTLWYSWVKGKNLSDNN